MSLHPSPPADRAPDRPPSRPRLVHEPDGVRVLLTGPGAPGGARGLADGVVDGAVDDAVHEARAHRAHHVLTSVEASGPYCAPLLRAARERVGVDVRQVRTRRAGSSVLVDLELLP